MNREEQIIDYNYADFDENALSHVMKWVGNQPSVGDKVPDFPIWLLTDDEENPLKETTLTAVLKQHALTIVEFGSFT